MKRKWLLVLVPVVAVVAVTRWPSDHDPAPDERIGARLAGVCPIARANIDTPLHGVDEVGGYIADNAPAILHDFAELVATIERIRDPRRHDRRAELASDRMFAPVSRCHRDLERFAEAVDEDEDAKERWEEGTARTIRTIGILLGETPDSLRDPAALVELLNRRAGR
jgi:hypothetical protein